MISYCSSGRGTHQSIKTSRISLSIGLVQRSFFHNGTCLYSITLGDKNPYYVISKDTNRIDEIDDATTADLRRAVNEIEDILRSRGYKEVVHVVEFFALAPKSGR